MHHRYLPSFAVPFFFATCVAAACGGIALPEAMSRSYPPQFDGADAETYKKIGDVELKLYVFKPADWKLGDMRPAILFFFGGGWNNGSPAQFEYQCRYLASRGMVAITADYRVASRQPVQVVDCVRDAKSAMRYVRGNAERLGIDPQKIVASGGSAGGHLAACLGTITGLDEPGEEVIVGTAPNAMLLFNPALMFDEAPGLALAWERTGIDPRDVSPFHHVKEAQPPTVLFFGSDDSMIDAAKAFTNAMQKAGNRCELETYEGKGHGFFNAGRDNAMFKATLERADQFLESLGFVSGPPTVGTFFD